jgi:hypothetical protein
MRHTHSCVICVLVFSPLHLLSQKFQDSLINPFALSQKLSDKYISTVSARSEKLSGDINEQSEKYLEKLQKQEAKIQGKLSKIDSVASKRIFTEGQQIYQQVQNEIQNKSQSITKSCGQYIPWMDTAINSLKFIQYKNSVVSAVNGKFSQVQSAIGKVHALEDEFKQAENVKEFIRKRKEYLKQELANYNLGAELKNYNSTAYYYAQQINEYKAAWDHPDQIEQKAIQILNSIPAFQSFMKKNSLLAGLFDIPDSYGASTGVAGLQTRDQIEQLIRQKMTVMGPNAVQTIQQNLQDAQSKLFQLRDKLAQYGNGGGDVPPDFQPNTQKTKKLSERFEYGIDIQSTHSTYFFPQTTNAGLSLGYKLNENNRAGIGLSYIMGWGRDIQHIAFTSQGIGLRSFVDLKIKKTYFVSGGLEYNYEVPFSSFQQIRDIHQWQSSGLVGISKIISIKTKLFKKTKISVLWDFLSYSQVPQAKPFTFRIGYNF